MRHKVKGRKLGRTASHRSATLKSLATELLRNKKIKTTLAKAREARTFVEPLITKAKANSVHSRRHIAKFVEDKSVVQELFNEIIPKIGERPGGYTRIVKLGNRIGDGAEMAIIELVDYNEPESKKKSKKKTKATTKKKSETKVEAVSKEVTEDSSDADSTVKEKAAPKTKKSKKSTAAKAKPETGAVPSEKTEDTGDSEETDK